MPCENSAKTSRFYLHHEGCLPLPPADKTKIAGKWEFIEWMAGRIGLSSTTR